MRSSSRRPATRHLTHLHQRCTVYAYTDRLRGTGAFRRADRHSMTISRRRPNKTRAGAGATLGTASDRVSVVQRDHMARVHVDDRTWAAFKQAAGPVPISELLGQLVTKHIDREAARRLRDGSVDDWQLLDALEEARWLHADVVATVAKLERRLDERAMQENAAATPW